MSEYVTVNVSEQRLAALLDKQEIQECLLRYTRGIDRHDTELAQSAYHEDARDDHAAYIGPGRGLVEWANEVHDAGLRSHQHYITNSTIDLDGDIAHAETYFIFAAIRYDESLLFGGGRYLDRLERRDGRWAIADRICSNEWFDDPELMAMVVGLNHPNSASPDDPSYARPLKVERPDRRAFGPGSDEATPL